MKKPSQIPKRYAGRHYFLLHIGFLQILTKVHSQSPSKDHYYLQQQQIFFPQLQKSLYYSLKDWYFGKKGMTIIIFTFLCILQKGDVSSSHSGVFKTSHLGLLWLLGWGILVLELKAFLIVSMNSHTSMIGHWPGHCSYPCDDTCCRIITENCVCGFSIFPSSTQDIYFTITYRHTTVFLFNQIKKKKLTVDSKGFGSKLKSKIRHALTSQKRRHEIISSLLPNSYVWILGKFAWVKGVLR